MKILYSKIQGKGEPLFILHGYFGMGDNWKSQANKLSASYQVHLIDQRNHGRSFHSDDFNYELLAGDLFNYMRFHKIESANILGHSMGGKTAMTFAFTYPEKVNKLVVVDISPKNYSPSHHEILKALNACDFSEVKSKSEVNSILKRYIFEDSVRQFLLKNLYKKTEETLDFRFNLRSLTSNNHEIGKHLLRFAKYKGPVLFLKGEHSEYISTEDFPIIKTHFSNAEVITIKNAGHWLHVENPSEFLKSVKYFLSKKGLKN